MTATETPSPERVALMRWAARMGAVTAEALADREGASVASARMRLLAAERSGLLQSRRPLTGRPALFAVTSAGLRMAGVHGLGPCRVSAANALHLTVCAEVAVALERCYPDHLVVGERELRRDEHECGAAIASASLGCSAGTGSPLHRPDLVLWPTRADTLPVAVEVELTVKAPRRLAQICRAWARCHRVAGVLYVAPPAPRRALERAIGQETAGARIAVVPLDALPLPRQAVGCSLARTVQGDA